MKCHSSCKNETLRSPLGKAKGHGAGGEGTHHWWHQRLTAVALIPLSIWFITVVLRMVDMDHAGFVEFVADPKHSIGLILFIIFAFYHAALGLQTVIEDYVHCPCGKYFMLITVKLGFFGLTVASLFSIFKIAFGA